MFDASAWMMQIVLFITLGLLVNPSGLIPIAGYGLLISAFLRIFARPISVLICLIPFKMSIERRLYISWVGLRGAVPIVFATYPLMAGGQNVELFFNLILFVCFMYV